MKKVLALVLALLMALSATAFASGNFSDEMKIPYAVDLSEEDGADSVERMGDHPDSPYFKHPDFYNMTSTDTLTILTNFKTYQQTSEWSCGVAAALMVLEYYGMLGDYNEETLAALRGEGLTSKRSGSTPGSTSLLQMIDIFEGVGGFELLSTFDFEDIEEAFTLDTIQGYLNDGIPIMIGWNDWGGHWQVIIGYDNMGTEIEQDDVIIVADPYDTTDHNQDGYVIIPAERFIYNFTFYDFFDEDAGDGNFMQFLVAVPVEQ